jgi:hypothetical protein
MLEIVTDLIAARVGTGTVLPDAVEAVLADAVRSLLAHGVAGDPAATDMLRVRPREAGLLVAAVKAADRTAPALDTATTLAVLSALRSMTKPIKRSGIGSQPGELWRLLWLKAAGCKMPAIKTLLGTTNDEKTLWRLHRGALQSIADQIEPLLPITVA